MIKKTPILFVLLFIYGCLTGPTPTRRVPSSDLLEGTSTPSIFNPISDDQIYWFYNNQNIGLIASINNTIKTVIYLRGYEINSYLTKDDQNFNTKYCLIVDYSLGQNTASKQLRIRLSPISIADFSTNFEERLFQVNLGNENSNQQICSGNLLDQTASSSIAYRPEQICPSCSNIIDSSSVRIYSVNDSTSDLTPIDPVSIGTSGLTLRINPAPEDSTEPDCNDSLCISKGYDCCLYDQCVINGQERPGASDHPNYNEAIYQVQQNFSKITDWPEIFYICPNKPIPTASILPTNSPEEIAQDRANYLEELLFCLKFAEADSANYNYCPHLFTQSSYNDLKNVVWDMCGCSTTGTPAPNDPQNTCTHYGLKAYDSNRIEIVDPTPEHVYRREIILNDNKTIFPSLRGTNVNSFLKKNNNYNNTYCLVFNFDTNKTGGIKQFRAVASPKQKIDFSDKYEQEIEYYLSPELYNSTINKSFCSGTVNSVSDSSEIAFKISDICPTCITKITSTSTNFYRGGTTIGTTSENLQGIAGLDFSVTRAASDTNFNAPNSEIYWYLEEGNFIYEIQCLPSNQIIPTPFQDLNITVSGKVAPHRFFNSSGTEIEDLSTVTSQTDDSLVTQEGASFFYTDQSSYIDPQNGIFNINSILGQMTVDLSNAAPAVVVDVNYDETYIISVISGNYSPCPTCIKDSWYPGLSAFPSTTFGLGLQAAGYTNARNELGSNFTGGNYEDTLFGRACWVPPTMIPFSHGPNSDLQTQRLNRLATQAAFFVNGYQRDWYGFNYGAVIGSFNGVNWFAIGKHRRVTARSRKLYLAINAPYADLAEPLTHSVHVVKDSGGNSASNYDYNPDLDTTDIKQNEAANCQQYHYCETDSDCITKLGWEYMCTQIATYRSLWPIFDDKAIEQSNQSKDLTYKSIITGELPRPSDKRCVYRGAGAPCVMDYTKLTNHNVKRAFICAPNFYCEDIRGSRFNDQINREPNNPTSIIYSRGANVLGRPEKYVGADSYVTTNIRNNIEANAAIQKENLTDNVGMCRPGKNLTFKSPRGDPSFSHKSSDNLGRTDYMSQIGSCNSSETDRDLVTDPTGELLALKRVSSCPVVDPTGNYYYAEKSVNTYSDVTTLVNSTTISVDIYDEILAQNSCGGESRYNGNSAFIDIEKNNLSSLSSFDIPAVVKDACLRRAGSVCHTNLDCSPNKIISEQAEVLSQIYFGDTIAEKKYWEEYLICSQAEEIPSTLEPTPPYDLTLNKCCRPIGEDFTMYTQGIDDPDYPGKNQNLVVQRSSMAIRGPSETGRYSRYTIIEDLQDSEPSVANIKTPVPMIPRVNSTPYPLQAGSDRPSIYQWKTISETGSKTCCGGGWIRKFADGTNDWTKPNRLNLDIANFKCINYRLSLPIDEQRPELADQITYDLEIDQLCEDSGRLGCVHFKDNRDKTYNGLASALYTVAPPQAIPTNTDQNFYFGDADGDANNEYYKYVHSYRRTGYLYDYAPYPPNAPDGFIQAVNAVYTADTSLYLFSVVDNDVPVFKEYYQRMVIMLPTYINGAENIIDIYHSFRREEQDPNNSLTGEGYEYQEIDDTKNNISYAFKLPRRGSGNTGICNSRDLSLGPYELAAHSEFEFFLDERIDNFDGSAGSKYRDEFANNRGANPNFGWCYNPQTGYILIKRPVCFVSWDLYDSNIIGTDPALNLCSSTYDLRDGDNDTITMYNLGEAFFDTYNASDAGIIINYRPMGLEGHYKNATTLLTENEGISPGNDLYYLKKLAQFELLGIPQIYYEPLYCSHNKDNLVPGLYSLDGTNTRTSFQNYSYEIPPVDVASGYVPETMQEEDVSILYNSNKEYRAVFNDQIEHPDIFSPQNFTCCEGLGNFTSDPTRCCSGYGEFVAGLDTQNYKCKLFPRTSLHVYFNKFVSGEGQNPNLPEEYRLNDDDYDPVTGYPKTNQEVEQKLIAIGARFCGTQASTAGEDLDGLVFTGAAFGNYNPRPRSSLYYSTDTAYGIAYWYGDSESVAGQSSIEGDKGYLFFNAGKHWNHHFYCGD